MTATVIKMRQPSITRLECSACGATADAACNCGAPYVSAGARAATAVVRSPEKSDRVIAAEMGIHPETVRRARKKSTAANAAVEKRTGKDGKARRLPTKPKRPEPSISDPAQEINAFHREVVGFLTSFTNRFTAWHDASPLIDKDGKATLMQAFYLCSDTFATLAQKLDGR